MTAEVWAATLAAMIVGIVTGLAIALWRRPAGGPPGEMGRQLETQAAELRRIADAAAQRELASEQLRDGLDGARRALEELRTRDQERRATDLEQREVIRRLATVVGGGGKKRGGGEEGVWEELL